MKYSHIPCFSFYSIDYCIHKSFSFNYLYIVVAPLSFPAERRFRLGFCLESVGVLRPLFSERICGPLRASFRKRHVKYRTAKRPPLDECRQHLINCGADQGELRLQRDAAGRVRGDSERNIRRERLNRLISLLVRLAVGLHFQLGFRVSPRNIDYWIPKLNKF